MPTRLSNQRDLSEGGRPPPIGLVLTGGGARAAYQVGVLSGVLEILDPDRSPEFVNPFPVICGTSAGAINAAAIACRADTPHMAIDRALHLWENIRTEMVYRSDPSGLLWTGLRWFGMLAAGWLMPGMRNHYPHSLLDNEPLNRLLSATLDFEHLARNLKHGYLDSLAITATGYVSGEHLTFYQSKGKIKPWTRSLRRAIACSISVDHLLASSSIPFIFPAQAMLVSGQTEWCGDGSMRQMAPMSPAIHLGAEKIFVVGTGYQDNIHTEQRTINSEYPSLAQIGGHALSNIFLDSLSMDVERLDRINGLLAQMPPEVLNRQVLRPVSAFVMTPSRSLDDLALEHLDKMPRAARSLFRVLGVSSGSVRNGSMSGSGGALISYLLFEAGYTQELIKLGRADSLSRVNEVKAFFKESPE